MNEKLDNLMNSRKAFYLFVISVLFSLVTSEHSFARSNYIFSNNFFPDKYASLVVDAKTGNVMHQENADKRRYPASLTKMMTLYMTFEALHDRRLNMNEMVTVSRHAASQPRMSLSLRAGEKIKVSDLIKSVIVLSANDSAVVLAERISGSEADFANAMTKTAKYLGMKNTVFANASGLPNPRQVTTAKDMAKLLISLKRDFPQYYNLMSTTSFYYKKQCFNGHNRLMKSYSGAKAGKTGFIYASGFNLALNAERNGSSLVGVVMGGRTAASRDNYMKRILDNNFVKLESKNPLTQLARAAGSLIPTIPVASVVPKQKPVITTNIVQRAEMERKIAPANIAKVNETKSANQFKNNFAMNDVNLSFFNKSGSAASSKKAPASLAQGYQPGFLRVVSK